MITSPFIQNIFCFAMNRKTTYLIPAFAAIFAMMFALAPSFAMAEYGDEMHGKWSGQKNHKMYKIVDVEGFVGSIQITEDADRESLKDQVTVSLSEAAAGLDVMGGHIGVVVNENDEKFLVWLLKSIEKNSESEISTVTIHVIDTADADNAAVIIRDIDHSQRDGKSSYDLEKRTEKIEQIREKLSESTGDADVDALRAAFVEKLQELKDALESGDSDKIPELRDELKDLRTELGSFKSYRG